MTTSPLKVEERKKFEEWYSSFYSIPSDWIIEHRHYERYVPYSSGIDLQWMAWQARALLNAPSSDLISTPQAVLDEKFIQHFGLKGAVVTTGITVKGDSDGD